MTGEERMKKKREEEREKRKKLHFAFDIGYIVAIQAKCASLQEGRGSSIISRFPFILITLNQVDLIPVVSLSKLYSNYPKWVFKSRFVLSFIIQFAFSLTNMNSP